MADQKRELEISMSASDRVTSVTKRISESMERMTSKMRRAFDRITSAAKAVTRTISAVLGPLAKIGAIASAIAGGAFAAMIKSAADFGDEIGKLSQRFGIATETLSELRYQAELSGTDFATTIDAFKDLSKNIFEASRGAGSALATFQELGVAVTDSTGKARSTEDVFLDLADAFSNMEDGNQKATQAMQVFGEAGQRIIPLLNSGRSGLKSMADEAKRLGLVIDKEAAQKAANFNDKLSLLNNAFRGLKFSIGLAFFDDLANTMKDIGFWIADHRDDIVDILKKIGDIAKTLVTSIVDAFGDSGARADLFNFFSVFFGEMFGVAGRLAGRTFLNSFTSSIIDTISTIQRKSIIQAPFAFIRDKLGIDDMAKAMLTIEQSADADTAAIERTSAAYQKLVDGIKSRHKGSDAPTASSSAAKPTVTAEEAIDQVAAVGQTIDGWMDRARQGFQTMTSAMAKFLKTPGDFFTEVFKDSSSGIQAKALGPWEGFVSGFGAASDEIKRQFEDLNKIGSRFAQDLHSTLAGTFFSAMKGELNSLEDAFRSTFTAIVDSLKAILADFMSSQVVNLFSSLLGGTTSSNSIYDAPFGISSGIFDKASPQLISPSGIATSSSSSGSGASATGTTVVFNVSAIDGQSVADMLRKNGRAIADSLTSAISTNNSRKANLRSALT